ncbi:helix-turn-helix domain-containing protein, partial [Parasediminibacterium sp. JCM 36343]|uniref:helix-turn-helix domain-containing protein n=1 Tax=Parasediminibacterium sp. JCM 36343 TaxID=3374279 RepID=UPI00397BEB28
LEHCFRTDSRHCVRQRCQMVLLKAKGFSSSKIGNLTGYSRVSVDGWVRRFEKLGLSGLYTKHGRGRKAILSNDDLGIVRDAVIEERQRLSQAKLLIEQGLGKQFSQRTLTRFLKSITAITSA